MITREATILADETQTAVGTKVVNINLTDPITRLLIPFRVTTAAGVRLAPLSAVFSKIEIVDGSDVLMSLSGTQIDGMGYFEGLKANANFTTNLESTEDKGNLVINFGRWLYDEKLAFDPTRYKNPQIKLTHNWATVEANATATDIAIHALIMENMAARPMGFLMKKEVKSWPASSGSWEYTQMPLDYPYRMIFLQCLTKTIGVGTHLSRIRLSEDNDKRIPFDVLIHDQVARNAIDYGLVVEDVSGLAYTSGHPFFCAPTYSPKLAVMNPTSQAVATFKATIWDGGQFEVDGDGSDSFRGAALGLCPQGLVAFPMGTPDILENWYDVTRVGNLRLEALGAGSHTVHLVVEQLRKYA